MKTDRLTLLQMFNDAPPDTLFSQEIPAAVRKCSVATIERDRLVGSGIPFVKIGRSVRYRKADIASWINQHQVVTSTSQYGVL